MEFFFDNQQACHPGFEATQGVKIGQPLLWVDLQPSLGIYEETKQLLYEVYVVWREVILLEIVDQR